MFQLLCAVFIGGGTGSVLRWWLGMKLNPVHHAIPIGTLTANLLGAFVIGAGLAWFNRLTGIDPMWKLLITTGFCGGLTTFSTFSAEVVFLLQQGRVSWALLNVAVNLLGSFAMTAVASGSSRRPPAAKGVINRQKKTRCLAGFYILLTRCLQSDYVCSRRAFGTVSDFELYALTFSQSFETVGLDCREVYEYIFAAIFRSNETESFGLIKPLNVTFNLRHQNYLYMKNRH